MKLIPSRPHWTLISVLTATAATTWAAPLAQDLAQLQGQWVTQKTNKEGEAYFHAIEVKDDRLLFKIIDGTLQTRMTARGKLKLEKLGPFQAFHLTEIQHGRTETDLEPSDETFSSIYQLRDGQWIIAANFDRYREDRKPGLDVYSRGTPSTAKAAAPAPPDLAAKLVGEWKMDFTMGENSTDYGLRFSRNDKNGVDATLISPRTGSYKFSSVKFDGADIVMEITRNFDGNDVPFLYKGKLKDKTLEGTVVVKGYEDRFSGTWKASQ